MKSLLLGCRGRDIDTGFTGTVTAHTVRLDETEYVELTSNGREGKEPQSVWVETRFAKITAPKKGSSAKR